jgi:hypothetical protein
VRSAAHGRVLRRRGAREDAFSVFPPEGRCAAGSARDEISPPRSSPPAITTDVKRLDEEVRARLELEQRFAHANEELKVLRDRLHRLERRREGAG